MTMFVCTKTHRFLVDKIPPEEPEHLSWKCKKGWSVTTSFFKKNNRGSCIARCEVKPKRSLSINQVNPRPLQNRSWLWVRAKAGQLGEELQRNQGWELQTGTREASHTHRKEEEKLPHLQFAPSWAPVHPSGQRCSHSKHGGSPGAWQGHSDRWHSLHIAERSAQISQTAPALAQLDQSFSHSWGMFYGDSRSCSLPIPTPAPCTPCTDPQSVSHTWQHTLKHTYGCGENNDLHLFCFIYIHILNFNTKEKKLESDKCLQTRYLQIDFTQFSLVQSKWQIVLVLLYSRQQSL